MEGQQIFININKTIEKKDIEINLEFTGEKTNNNSDDYEDKILLENMFLNPLFNYDASNVIATVRTVLKDYKEIFLFLQINTKNNQYIIEYINGKITKYTIKNNKLNINYKLEDDLKFSIYLAKKEANFNYTEIRKFMDNEMKKISLLENIKPLEINHIDRVLIKLYELFYNQKPNFNSLNINNKIQSMMYILEKNGISLTNGNPGFNILGENVTSIYYLDILKKLIPMANTPIDTNTVYLSVENIKKIKLIRDEICNFLQKYSEENKWKIFRKMCTIDYVKTYILPSNASNIEVANHEYVKASAIEVEKTLNLINKIK